MKRGGVDDDLVQRPGIAEVGDPGALSRASLAAASAEE
jgi:hypothetical protein